MAEKETLFEERFLTLDEVCARHQIAKPTAYTHMKKGLFPPHIKLAGSMNRWPLSELIKWERAQIEAAQG